MKAPLFTGCATAIITPFHESGVDFRRLGEFLDFQIRQGTDAIVVCGTTGEASTMSYSERMETIAFCVERIAGRIPVIAGSGSNSTENALSLSRDAAKAGANGLLLVTPYYNKTTQTGLLRHYQVIADAAEVPCILYNVPSRTGMSIAPETCAALAKHPNINGIKEASGNLAAIARMRNLCPEDFSIWSGNDNEVVPICALGGVGVISVLANLLPDQIHAMTQLCLDNDFAAAGKLQLYFQDLCDALFCEVNPIPVKAALRLTGWNMGDPRPPLCLPEPDHLALLRRTLEKYGFPLSQEA